MDYAADQDHHEAADWLRAHPAVAAAALARRAESPDVHRQLLGKQYEKREKHEDAARLSSQLEVENAQLVARNEALEEALASARRETRREAGDVANVASPRGPELEEAPEEPLSPKERKRITAIADDLVLNLGMVADRAANG